MRILNDNYFTYRQTPVDYDGIAKIESIKGNSVAFNQLHGTVLTTTTQGGVTFTHTNDYTITLSNSATSGTSKRTTNDGNPFSIINGHKYLLFGGTDKSGIVFRLYQNGWSDALADSIPLSGGVVTASMSSNSAFLVMQIANGTNCNNVVIVPQIIDITQLNDSRVTDLNSFKQYYPLPYYSYTLGTLVSFNGTGIKTTGKNLLENTLSSQTLNGVTITINEDKSVYVSGLASATTGFDIVTNLQNGSYIFNGTSITGAVQLRTYPDNTYIMDVIGDTPYTISNSQVIYRIRVANGTNANWTIYPMVRYSNVSDSTYEPYFKKSASLPISSYFPTGMKSAGSVYDEISNGKAITRIGSVDMGSLAWTYDSSVPRFYASAPSNAKVVSSSSNVANIICPLYSTVSIDTLYTSVTNVIGMSTGGVFSVKTSAYSDSATFTTAMSGVYLYYELSTYTEADFKEDIYYYFFDKGTEQLLPVNTSTPSTTPLLADIIYYDTREGETPYRKFWMINTKGERWNLTERDFKSFLNNPQNLGYSKTITVNRYGNAQNLVDVTDNFPQPSGEIIFYDSANSSRYEKYNRLIDFLSYYPITLYYQLPFSIFSQIPNIYTLECVAVSLGKTESKTDGMMTCPITFNGLSFYKGDTVEINGSGDTYTLTNEGDFPVGFEITIKGTLNNPYFTLEQDGELYGEAKFDDSTAFGEVYVDSIDGEQNIILKQGGSVLANPLGYRDLSISNGSIYVTFVKLQRGESTLTIGYDSGSITSVDVSFTPIYRSV